MMGTMHPDLTHISDPILLNKIMSKRQAEAERRQRFFDVKNRTIGIDKGALDQQVAEKRLVQEALKNEEVQYVENALLQDQIGAVVEDEKVSRARQKHIETMEYSRLNLRKEDRREYALSDPDQLKKDLPARIGDDDPRCGPASVQKLDGEEFEKRRTSNKKTYQDLQKGWLLEQIAHKQAVEQGKKDEHKSHDDQMIMANHVRGVMETHIEATKRSNKKAESDHNLMLASEVRDAKRNQLARQHEEEGRHVSNVMSDKVKLFPPLFDRAEQRDINGRLISGTFRGMSHQQQQECHEYNAMLMQQKRNIKRAEKEEAARHAQSVSDGVAVMGSIEYHKAQLEIQKRMKMDSENSVLIQEQRNKQLLLKTIYSNKVDEDEYFRKFNASAR